MTKNIQVVEDILSANDSLAAENRAIFDTAGIDQCTEHVDGNEFDLGRGEFQTIPPVD